MVVALLGYLGPEPVSAASSQEHRIIAKAECSATGIRITFEDNSLIQIPTDSGSHSACQEIRVSADGKVAAWVVACTGVAINGNGEGKEPDGTIYQAVCARLTGLARGRTFDIEELAAYVGKLAFKGTTHDLKYRAAPMHGLGTVVLYDMDRHTHVLICAEGDASPRCAELTGAR